MAVMMALQMVLALAQAMALVMEPRKGSVSALR